MRAGSNSLLTGIGAEAGAHGALFLNSDVDLMTSARAVADPFTAHVFTSILEIGAREAREHGESVGAAVGLARGDLTALIETWAPGAARLVAFDEEPQTVTVDEEEAQLRSLLAQHVDGDFQEAHWLVAMIARRAMSPRHLWQDLGLADRGELSRLLNERFPVLAARNVSNMKWKKFFFRVLCEMEGFSLCAAPSCEQCADFDDCFGDEGGESALARVSRNRPV